MHWTAVAPVPMIPTRLPASKPGTPKTSMMRLLVPVTDYL